ncbi:hypothetical protein S245_043138 [Arachis hypogaea]
MFYFKSTLGYVPLYFDVCLRHDKPYTFKFGHLGLLYYGSHFPLLFAAKHKGLVTSLEIEDSARSGGSSSWGRKSKKIKRKVQKQEQRSQMGYQEEHKFSKRLSDLEKQEKDEMELLRKLLDDIIDMRLSNYDYSDEGKSKSSSSFVRTHSDPSFLKYSQGSRETTSISYSDFSSFKDTVTLDSSSEIEETESKGSRLPLAPLLSSDTTEAFSGMHNQVEADIIPKTKQKKDTQSSFGKADIPITPQADDDLPVKVENLVTEDLDELRSSFETLKVSTVPQLKSLSSNLHSLKIEGCESLEALPDDLLAGTTALKELYLISCCSLKSFPYPAASLTTLYMRNCRRMRFLPSSESRKKLASLEHLFIGSSCDSLTTLTLDSFCKLKILCIWDCHNLQSVNVTREFKGDLASLESLEIRDCPRLRFLPDGALHTPNLESILISNCKNLNALPSGMNFLTSLKTLFLNRCPAIESLPLGGLPSSLIVLSIAYCDKLIPQEDWGLCSLESLRRFELEGGCMGMESFPNEKLPCNINSLRISTLNSLKKLNHKGLQHLNVLHTLEIHGCDILRSLPDQGLPSSLINLCVQECPLLTPRLIPKRGKEWHKVAHIPNIQIDHQIVSAY